MNSYPEYKPESFEARWQQAWENSGQYHAHESTGAPRFYCLDFFPYPSGEGLHVGHCRNYVPTDVVSRYKRMQGFEVLHPMGWDAFGEPTEQFAITHGVHPRLTTDRNTANYRRQMRLIGTSYDWSRELDSSRPEYYRWTQWFFLRLYRRGLAYRDQNWQWWCPTCATTLSSHEIHGDRCWRGHSGITKRQIPAWYFRITAYADPLIDDLESVDWPEPIKTMQRNWIGRSYGAEINFMLPDGTEPVAVFTTRPDTLYGVTFLVLAPEHPLVDQITTPDRRVEIQAYREQAIRKSEIDRAAEDQVKSGMFTGGFAHHPLSHQPVPVWVAEYVLPTYGTGAVMGVPAHDQRDFEFAARYALPVVPVVFSPEAPPLESAAYEGGGLLGNSGEFDGLDHEHGGEAITNRLAELGLGRPRVNYRMRDWLISRQRYWGTPIPIIYCPACGEVPVPEEDLPVLLPDMEDFSPDGSGRSPLARVAEFVNTTCPLCGGSAQRETDTLGGFACSSWYFLRFTSPNFTEGPFEPQAMNAWMPVDLYVGGAEHAVLHLLYSRFWTKALADENLLPFTEPFSRLLNQGQLHASDGFRMAKSRGNIITPDEMVARYGADALRLHVMFMAPFENDVEWNEDGIRGVWRFLNRVWQLYHETYSPGTGVLTTDESLSRAIHRFVRDVTERIESFRLNTMVSTLMEFTNLLYECRRTDAWRTQTYQHALETLLVVMAPAVPYIAEEIWQRTGHHGSVHNCPWPSFDAEAAAEQVQELPVQVDGRLRGVIQIPVDWSETQIEAHALSQEIIQPALADREVIRVVVVAGKIVNIVTKPGG
jgi:leucyl-tRNA synthetase